MQYSIKKSFFLPGEEKTFELARKIAEMYPSIKILHLNGGLGTGKTSFCRGFLRALGYKGLIKSPTYTTIEYYTIKKTNIYHFDLYRVVDMRKLEIIDIRSYFTDNSICLIEWAEHCKCSLPNADVIINFQYHTKGRKVLLETNNEINF